MDLLLATRNAHKTREFAEILGEGFRVTDLSDLPGSPEIAETGSTFAENAILKAVQTARFQRAQQAQESPLLLVADDSGLEVDALDGAPGIFSARYAGEGATDQANVAKLLNELRQVPPDQRTARFRCVIALVQGDNVLGTFEGTAEGVIVDVPRGAAGFGYDPIFQPKGFDQTFAELSRERKNQISHRAKAIASLREALRG